MLVTAALALASRGLAVFPCRPRDKRPATAAGCKNATKDPSLIEFWWRAEPRYNVAIATGSISGVFVVDIDGLDAEAELRKLEREHGELPSTVEAITARGRHVYFRMPALSLRNSAGKIAPNVDTRANGGYVLAPPSIHPSGRAYAWSVDGGSTFASAPQWLLDRLADPAKGAPVAPSVWRDLTRAGVEQGVRNDTLTRLTGHLLRRRIDPIVALELLLAFNATRCRPPLPEGDVERIVNSIAARELRRRGAA